MNKLFLTKLSRCIAQLPPGEPKMELMALVAEQEKEERRRENQRNRTRECRKRKDLIAATQKRYGNNGKNVTVTDENCYSNTERYCNSSPNDVFDLSKEIDVTVTNGKTGYIYSNSNSNSKKERKKEYTLDFETFWNQYPKKVAKPKALRAFLRAMKDKVPLATILDCLKNFVFPPDVQYVPYPATWLNDRHWEDQPSSSVAKPLNGAAIPTIPRQSLTAAILLKETNR